LVRQIFGAGFALELVMPDGSKKNSKGNNPDGAASVVRAAPPEPRAPSGIAVVEPRVEVPAEPAQVESASAELAIQARVEPRIETQTQSVQVLERPVVIAESDDLEPAPTTPRTTPAFVQDGPIHIADALPTALEFDALGKPPSPEESLFGAKTYGQAVEPEAANLEPTTIQMLEPSEAPELEMQPVNAPADDEVALDAGDVPFFEEGPPLELYDAPASAPRSNPQATSSARLKTPDASQSQPRSAPRAAPQASTDDAEAAPEVKSPAKLRAHPNYEHLAKLLTHRVREAGVIEGAAKSSTEPASESEVPVAEEAEA
jgi:hypothetical protein